ncbi:hypothetical protein [Psychrobacillus sp.]|uniref:hypothetical protein n=1 Tax=Psychrobacillus sp. TaxID=1871623 RepID=UPI0028BEC541|nr:hypothetical protein [Psychrobacillus sp.]
MTGKDGETMAPIDERIELQDERLNKHDERLNQHGERILQLENWDKDKHQRIQLMEQKEQEHEKRIKDVEQNYTKLENTIMSENKETRMFFQSNMDKQWDLIKSRDDQRLEDKRMQHDDNRMKLDLEKTKFERWSDIFFKLAGTGGILYLIVQALVK